jgi:serine/threonine-protein kinase HipA
MPRRSALNVWLHGVCIATITSPGPGKITLTYTPEALDRWPGNTPLLSCSLPLASRPHKAAGVFFKGLLPEGHALQALAQRAGVATIDTFGLLERFGRDVAGACVIGHEGPADDPGSLDPYDPASLDDEVASLEDNPLAIHDDSSLSLPGLQNKLLLVATEHGWARPVGGRPSTHILKIEDRRYPGLVTLEADALRLARLVGLTTIDVQVETHAGIDCVVVSRYDRTDHDGTTVRIHQEDACQALGIDPDTARGHGKYEYAGGPSLRQVAGLLDTYAPDGITQLMTLARAVAFTVCIGNADAHGKNLALIHGLPDHAELAPLYDTVPTLCFPKLKTRAAMHVNERTDITEITLDDIVTEAVGWRLSRDAAEDAVRSTIADLVTAVDSTSITPALAELVRTRGRSLLS